MTNNILVRVIRWAARHFLTTWAVVFAIGQTVSMFDHSGRLWDIWFWTAAPFLFVFPLTDRVAESHGKQVGDVIAIGLVACIYIAMDAVLWTVIRSARRGSAFKRRESRQRLGIRDKIDLTSAWIVRHAFPLWALVTATGLFFGCGFEMDMYEPSIRATILYGSMILALPIWPLLLPIGRTLSDPVIRAIVLSCFVIVCVIIDVVIKQQIRKVRAQRAVGSPFN